MQSRPIFFLRRFVTLATLGVATVATLVLTVGAGAPSPLVVPTDWPEFRGLGHSGVADDAGLPTAFDGVSGDNVAWKTPIPGMAHSSPIVLGDTVYVTSSVAEAADAPTLITGDSDRAGIDTANDMVSHTWSLHALDKHTGAVRWSRVATTGVPRVKRHVKASHASATPASDGARIVALFDSEGLFCFDLDGNLLWRRDVGELDVGYWGEPEYQWGPASSPVIYEDLVFVQNDRQADSVLVAYALDSGAEVWRAERDEKPAWSTPTVVRGERDELVLNGANWLTAYAPRTGEPLWRLSNADSEVIVPTPIVADGRIVITGGYPTGGRPIYAIRPGGSGDITPGAAATSHLLWQTERGSSYTPTPIAYRGVLYVIVDNGILSAYDLESGERLYRERLGVGAGYSASPVASDGRIYFPSEDGDVVVIQAGREFELLAENPMGEPLMASPAISDGLLIVRGTQHVFAIAQAR